MPDLLIELFSEEIPARMQTRAAEDLKKLVTNGLVEAGLTYANAGAFSTPRRLVLTVEGMLADSPTTREERKGPRVDAPEKALTGFLRSTGLTKDQLEARDDKKGQVYFAVIEKPGRPAADIVAEVLEKTVRQFPWPKSMRWGAGALRWVRPLHSILCITYDEAGAQVVPLDIDGIASGDTTEGHRFMAPDRFAVTSFDDFESKLKRAHVTLRAEERADHIWQDATNMAFAQGLEVVEDKGLLAEVAGLVEHPVVLLGDIADDFLDLPPEVLQTSMKEHQKFFSVRNPKTGRIEKFVTVANVKTADNGATILAGNQKVLFARLSDAKFFWENDLRTVERDGLAAMSAPLANVTFHNKLGSQAERITRIAALAREIAPLVGADPDDAAKAAEIAKADLSSEMVFEFPELQGTMGKYYARHAKLSDAIANACEQHYSPLGPSDDVPSEPVSVAVALADKIDTLTGFWAIDEKPTGSKDPFALRRAALGVIRLIGVGSTRVHLSDLIDFGFLVSLAHSGSTYGNHPDAGKAAFLEDGYKVLMEGLNLKGAAIPFVLESEQLANLQGDIDEGFNWKSGEEGADVRLKSFYDRVALSDWLTLSLANRMADSEFEKKYPGETEEHNQLKLQFLAEMSEIKNDLLSFLHDRLKTHLREDGIRHDVIDACLAMPGNDDLTLLVKRAKALSAFLKTDDGEPLLQGFKRANNILTQAEEKDGVEYSYGADIKFAEEDSEKTLFKALESAQTAIKPAMAAEDFETAMQHMASLRAPIDAFFESVQINAESEVLRRNRLNLLHSIRTICGSVADLTKLEG